jgi:hypothetical protein
MGLELGEFGESVNAQVGSPRHAGERQHEYIDRRGKRRMVEHLAVQAMPDPAAIVHHGAGEQKKDE